MADETPVWNADHARVTLFSRDLWAVDQAEFITNIVGVEVDATSSRPAMSETKTSAVLGNGRRLEVHQQVNRLDFVVQPTMDQISEDGPPVLADAAAEMRLLIGWVRTWLAKQNSPVVRVAIGAGALLPCPDRTSSYSKLRELLPMVQLDPERHRDFQLRLNTPVPSSTLTGLEINALATWSSIFLNTGFFGVAPNTQVASVGVNQRHFVHCAVDVNTDALRAEPIPSAKLPDVLQEVLAVSERLLRGAT